MRQATIACNLVSDLQNRGENFILDTKNSKRFKIQLTMFGPFTPQDISNLAIFDVPLTVYRHFLELLSSKFIVIYSIQYNQ
jgi:hypothetical protein